MHHTDENQISNTHGCHHNRVVVSRTLLTHASAAVKRKACDIGEGDKLVTAPNGKTRCGAPKYCSEYCDEITIFWYN